MRVQLLHRDQYGRVVACARRPRFLLPAQDISLAMLRAGWATTYAQAGAQYGDRTKEQFIAIEEAAKCVGIAPRALAVADRV